MGVTLICRGLQMLVENSAPARTTGRVGRSGLCYEYVKPHRVEPRRAHRWHGEKYVIITAIVLESDPYYDTTAIYSRQEHVIPPSFCCSRCFLGLVDFRQCVGYVLCVKREVQYTESCY